MNNTVSFPIVQLFQTFLVLWIMGFGLSLIVSGPFPRFQAWYLRNTRRAFAAIFRSCVSNPVRWVFRTQKRVLLAFIVGVLVTVYLLSTNQPGPRLSRERWGPQHFYILITMPTERESPIHYLYHFDF